MWTKSLSVCRLCCLKRMDVLLWKSSMASWILFRSLAAAQETDQCQFMIMWCTSRRRRCHFVVWVTRGLVIKFPDWVPKVPFGVTAVHRAELWTCTPVNPSHGSVRFYPVSCPKNTLTGKAFEGEERYKITPHSNFCRCTKRTIGGATSSGKASGISLSRQKCSGSEGIIKPLK